MKLINLLLLCSALPSWGAAFVTGFGGSVIVFNSSLGSLSNVALGPLSNGLPLI